jgi:hypothetical protein
LFCLIISSSQFIFIASTRKYIVGELTKHSRHFSFPGWKLMFCINTYLKEICHIMEKIFITILNKFTSSY